MKTLKTKLRLGLFLAGVILVGAGTLAALWPRPVQAEGQSSTALATTNSETQETSFGDLTADALKETSGANIALVAAISFKPGSLGPGPLTAERVGSLLANPDETWAVSRLQGKQLREALEHAVHSAPLPSSSFLQVAGLSFEYNAANPRGQRVSAVRVGYTELMDDASYTVAMPLSLAKGGSGFFKFFTKERIERQSDQSLVATAVAFAGTRGSVSYSGFGRITAR